MMRNICYSVFLWLMLGTTERTILISSLQARQIIKATYRGKPRLKPAESVALQDVAEGSTILSIPMRLALTDQLVFEDALQNETSEGSLAARLLKEHELGSSSAWFPYIQVILAKTEANHFLYDANSMTFKTQWLPLIDCYLTEMTLSQNFSCILVFAIITSDNSSRIVTKLVDFHCADSPKVSLQCVWKLVRSWHQRAPDGDSARRHAARTQFWQKERQN